MGTRKPRGIGIIVMVSVMLTLTLHASNVFAVTSSSSHYQVTETEFGAGTSPGQQSCSGQYCATVSIGDIGSGKSSNTTTTAQFGSITSDEPLLEVIVDAGASNLGDLTTEKTATKTMVVRIRSYLSDGYILQITGDPPKYNGRALHTSGTPESSRAGTEQFGINAVANPVLGVGAAPEQVPAGQATFGEVYSDYAQADKFMYVSGANVAHSATESGQTNYTITMVVNVSNATPAGRYTSDFSAVVIPVY